MDEEQPIVCVHNVPYPDLCWECQEADAEEAEARARHERRVRKMNDKPNEGLEPYVFTIGWSDFRKAEMKWDGKVTFERKLYKPSFTDSILETVIITLYPTGHTRLEIGASAPTEEGHSYWGYEIDENGDVWEIEHTTGGSDCDGPSSHHTVETSDGKPYAETDANYHPEWPMRSRTLDHRGWQRDEFAERMGY